MAEVIPIELLYLAKTEKLSDRRFLNLSWWNEPKTFTECLYLAMESLLSGHPKEHTIKRNIISTGNFMPLREVIVEKNSLYLFPR